jgi:hypothetical protein
VPKLKLLHSDNGCFFVDGGVTSGSFFEDLKRVSVPLGDHLIVSVFAPDGTPLTRLSAAP